MATIFAANESNVLVNGNPIVGVRSIEYRRHQVRDNIYALGSAERIALTSGPSSVEGRLTIASTNPDLDLIVSEKGFQITAQFRHADSNMVVTFDDCFLVDKTFEMGVGGHGEAVYSFSATRVREEIA